MGNEQLSQMLAAVGYGKGVEAVVAERGFSGGDGTDAFAGCLSAEPGQSASRRLHSGEGVDERHELRIDPAGSVVEEPVQARPQRAAPTLAQGPKVVIGTTGATPKSLGDPAAADA